MRKLETFGLMITGKRVGASGPMSRETNTGGDENTEEEINK